MAKDFRNIKMSVKGTKLDLTINCDEFMQGADLPISSTGVTYNVASTFGGHKLVDDLDGLYIDVKVYTKKEYYDKRRQHLAQIEMAKKAQAEFAQNTAAQQALSALGIDPAMLAQAIGIVQTMQAQQAAQPSK